MAVQELQPQSVVVELCRSRAGVMYDDPASPEVYSTGRVEPIVLPQYVTFTQARCFLRAQMSNAASSDSSSKQHA